MHDPVLKEEILELFKDVNMRTFVDGTLGAGGHAKLICEHHQELMYFIGFDQDALSHELCTPYFSQKKYQVHLVHKNFSSFQEYLDEACIDQVDGILLDLGVSSMQLDRGDRGFSFQKEGPLDMRMDPSSSLTARDIVMTWSQKELERVFKEYGEEPKARAMARLIVDKRGSVPLKTTKDLVTLLYPVALKNRSIHPLTLAFQGLRIAVNQELHVLHHALPLMIDRLRQGGRLGIISYHSLEDKIVKEVFKAKACVKNLVTGALEDSHLRIITKKPIVASQEEIDRNPRSRSAKMRFIEKL